MKKLECIANEVLQPVTMKWTVNNNDISSKTFYEISNQTVAWTQTFDTLKETDVVNCKVSGPNITQVTTSFNCSRNDEELGSPLAVFVMFTIISLVLTGIGVSCLICKKKYTGAICRVTNINRVARSERKDSVTVVYSKPSTNEERENIDTVEDDGISNSISQISKGTCLKVGEKFEYWKCSFTNVINEEKHCIVKTLTANSTITEAEEFRKLAKRLKTLRKNAFIVDLLSVSLDIVPSIAYMFMEFGTLRDLLLMRYEKTRSPTSVQQYIIKLRDSYHYHMMLHAPCVSWLRRSIATLFCQREKFY
ncbi:uncharacterized protein [Apostichopus japonicus]|uniref:uncharacterized protein n=1 Tax=Stichopus japonicus TaxID=307972 RepID=UPI003AB4DBB1